ncbi:AraC-type DNA-binding protein [Roseateles sp. YR242]|uniref:helix-turn-helix domain-containing protein n=1 Tax=Roseateles sp. YR242 TaxID=1855305 RepID=UPI0008AEB24E|nr:AraC family transcriptional regulator [Roseateles sp. YR242]SEK54378.1 AraC-type DNA-binding protein [Roseateles sp. YR242]
MSAIEIRSSACLKSWYLHNGVEVPQLRACIGPLPSTGAYVAQWSSHEFDEQPREILPHPNFLRVAVMLEPLESQVWKNDQPVWGGIIGAHHFRVCGPDERGRWTQLSRCNIANVFIPLDTVRRYVALAGRAQGRSGAENGAHWPQVQQYTQDRRVADLTLQMLDATAMRGDLALHYCDGLMTALLAYLLEHYGETEDARPVSALRGQPLRQVLAHIHRQAGRDLYVTELAAMTGMSESHFSREFKRAVGMPPHQYLLTHRLDEARRALSGTDERIGDIAFNLGFTDASHFSRLFSNRFGVTPTRFRRHHRHTGASALSE